MLALSRFMNALFSGHKLRTEKIAITIEAIISAFN
jgi:hypothetical protein